MRHQSQDPRLKLEKGWAHYEKAEYQEGLKLLDEAAAALPDDALAHYRLGFCLRALRQHSAALDSFRTASDLLPEDAWAQFQIGKELIYLGRRREALPEYARALEMNSRFAEAYNDLGAILAMLGFHELSAAAYTTLSVLADMAVQGTGKAPIHLAVFEASTNTLKRVLGSKYSQIHDEVFSELGDPQQGEVDLEGFDRVAAQIVAAVRSIVRQGIPDEGWHSQPDQVMGPWLTFSGKASEMRGRILLVADLFHGTLLANCQDVRQLAGKVEVIRGARVEILDAPLQERDPGSKRDDVTSCIGKLEIHCATGKIIGSCEGVWGCCRRHRERGVK